MSIRWPIVVTITITIIALTAVAGLIPLRMEHKKMKQQGQTEIFSSYSRNTDGHLVNTRTPSLNLRLCRSLKLYSKEAHATAVARSTG